MDIIWNSSVIDPQNLISIARGDREVVYKYLKQFLELIPSRVENLKESMMLHNRKLTRQILHQMAPQLQFFGVPDTVEPIARLESDYAVMPFAELQHLVNEIVGRLEQALIEVEKLMRTNFQ